MATALSDWFRTHLQASGDGFVWAVEQVPAQRRYARPPGAPGSAPLGDWSAARHAYHMLYYEQNVALPRMRHWLFEACRETPVPAEDVAWGEGHDLEFILSRFRTVRAGQIALLAQYDEADWDDERYFSGWGSVS